MGSYRVTLAGDGPPRTVRVEADGPEAVARALGADPLDLLSVEPADAAGGRPWWLRAPLGDALDERAFAQALAVLLDAGIPLLEAVQTLREKDATPHPALDRLQAALRSGQAFSAALEAAGAGTLLVALAAASERSGQLGHTLAQHAQWLAWRDALRSRLVAAAIYPAMLLGASVAVILFLLLFVLPRFAGVFEGLATPLPAGSRWLLELGSAAAAQPWSAIALALAPAFAAVATWHWPAARAAASAGAARLPLLGPRLREVALARLYRVLALLLDAGIPALPALRLADRVLAGPMQAALRDAAAAVARGQRLSEALDAAGLATPVALRMLRVGERSGATGAMLARAAAFHDEALARLSDLVTRIVNPALMLVMGGVIGTVVVLMYLPIFSLVESVG